MNDEKKPTEAIPAGHVTADNAGVRPEVGDIHDEDLRLMELVAAGNSAARSAVAHRLVRRVRRLSRMLLLDEALADDVSQNSLIEILHSARTYQGRSSLERWADRIVARTAIRQARDERRRDGMTESFAGYDTDHHGSSPSTSLREAAPRPVEDYLSRLPSAQREALVLKHSLDYTTEEIAEMTGTAVGTVKDRLVTARRQVRRMIQRDLSLMPSRGGGKK